MSEQLTNKVLMIRPAHFGFNQQTAGSNRFQQMGDGSAQIEFKAIEEFDQMVAKLRANGIHVVVIQDLEDRILPDAIFPNNWFTTHYNGILYTYPMLAPVRREERREDIMKLLETDYHYTKRYSLEVLEKENQFLEGTGSMVFDRVHKIAYACLSQRTDIRALDTFAMLSHYKIVHFNASDQSGAAIYHTNVLMAMGHDFVICCMEAVQTNQREMLIHQFAETKKLLIEISFDQMNCFAGNMLELLNDQNEPVLVMSQSAYESLNAHQKTILEARVKLINIPIPTIEKVGGGSVRCMMAELI